MPTLAPQVTPYYGGGQVVKPANTSTITTSVPSTVLSTNDHLGDLKINNSAASAFILVSKSGGTETWLNIGGGAGTFTSLTASSGNITATNGNLVLGTAGNKLVIPTGSNASIGTSAAMTAGTITISTTAVTASSKIFLTNNTPGGTIGILSAPVASITAGTSFVINSSSSSDTSTVNWWIIN